MNAHSSCERHRAATVAGSVLAFAGAALVTALVSAGAAASVAAQQGTAYFPVPAWQTHPQSSTPWAVALGDLNADGLPDAVTANDSSDNVSILLALPEGGFALPVVHEVEDKPRSIAIGDVDGDGHADVVAGCFGTASVVVLLGNGEGGISRSVSIAAGISPGKVAVADLDGDGWLDIVCGNSGAVTVLRSIGGVFQLPQAYPAPGISSDFELADVIEDGQLDVVAAGDAGLTVLPGLGAAVLGPPQTFRLVEPGGLVAVGDLDGDGHADAVISPAAGHAGALRVLLGDGAGGWTHGAGGSTSSSVAALEVADLDFDAHPDVVCTSQDIAHVLRGDGAGGLLPESVAYWPSPLYPVSLAVTDATADGRPDVLAPGRDGTLVALPGDGLGSLLSMATLPASLVLPVQATSPTLADLDGDGHLDLAHALLGQPVVQMRAGDGDGALGASTDLPLVAGVWARAIVAVDLNEDEVLDLAVAASSLTTGKLTLFPGDGNGGYLPGTDVAGVNQPTLLAAAFMNGDDHLDLVAHSTNSGLQIMTGDGQGHVTVVANLSAVAGADALAVDDFDGDGKTDVAVSFAVLGKTPKVFWGDGNGAFEAQSFLPLGNGSSGIVAVRANADALVDIACLNASVQLCLALAPRVFADPLSLPAGGYQPKNLRVTDFDRDGHPDFVVAASQSSLSVLRGDGAGHFESPRLFGAWDALTAFAVGDLDEDGRPDAVALSAKGVSGLSPGPRITVMPNGASSVGPWTDLGLGLGGSIGVPQLTGTGALAPVSPVALAISGARPFGLATLVIGPVAIDAPFKGGTLVPLPSLLLAGLPLDGAGQFAASGTWYGGLPSGTATYFQAWVADPAGPAGFAATNGLRGVTP